MTELDHDNTNSMNPDGGMSPVPPGSPPAQSQPVNGMAITSFVLGLISVVGSCACGAMSLILVLPLGGTGIILAVLSRKRPGQRGLGTAGLILSICALAISVIWTILLVILFALDESHSGGSDAYTY